MNKGNRALNLVAPHLYQPSLSTLRVVVPLPLETVFEIQSHTWVSTLIRKSALVGCRERESKKNPPNIRKSKGQ